MEQRDYFMRYIEHFAESLAKVMGFMKTGRYDDGLKYVEQLYDSYFEEHKAILLEAPEEDWPNQLKTGKELTLEELNLAGELLYYEGELWEKKGEDIRAKVRYKRALDLMEYLHKNDPVYNLDRAFKMEKIKDYL